MQHSGPPRPPPPPAPAPAERRSHPPPRPGGLPDRPRCTLPGSSRWPTGTTCLEGGSFLLNFVGCAQCGRRDFVLLSNRAAGLHGGDEIVTYDHLCKNCHHLIARHEYTFSVVDDYQEYTMLCLLCGRAEDSVSILPDDPRQMTPLF